MANLERIPEVPTWITDPNIRKYLMDLTRVVRLNMEILNISKVEEYQVQEILGSSLIAGGTLTVTYNAATRETTVTD